jgi:hypothetical protein
MYICFYSEGRCAKKTMNTHRMVLLRRAGERADENGLCKLPTAASLRTDRNLARSTYIFIRTKLSIGQLAEREMARATAWLFLSQGSTHPFSRFTHPFPRFKPSRGYQFLVFGGRRIQPLSTLPSNTRHPSQPKSVPEFGLCATLGYVWPPSPWVPSRTR